MVANNLLLDADDPCELLKAVNQLVGEIHTGSCFRKTHEKLCNHLLQLLAPPTRNRSSCKGIGPPVTERVLFFDRYGETS